ncbi:MAG: DUF1097 domain-containing protein [Kiloniellales bacterium]
MPQTVALSLSIAVLGAIWTFVALLAPGFLSVWAAFLAWACFFHTGGDDPALRKTIVGNIFGIIIAWIVLLILANVPVSIPGLPSLWPAVVVGVGLFVLVVVSGWEQLPVFPAHVYGYAAVVAHTGLSLDNLLVFSFANPGILLIVSMVIGALLGWVSQRVATQMTKQAA